MESSGNGLVASHESPRELQDRLFPSDSKIEHWIRCNRDSVVEDNVFLIDQLWNEPVRGASIHIIPRNEIYCKLSRLLGVICRPMYRNFLKLYSCAPEEFEYKPVIFASLQFQSSACTRRAIVVVFDERCQICRRRWLGHMRKLRECLLVLPRRNFAAARAHISLAPFTGGVELTIHYLSTSLNTSGIS